MPATRGRGRPARCAQCDAALDSNQHYCLSCGSRVGARSGQLNELVRRARGVGEPPAVPVAPASAHTGSPDAREHARHRAHPAALLDGLSALKLPSPRISALLVLVFVGFGVLLGSVAGTPVSDSLAASARAPVKLLLPPAATSSKSPETSTSAEEPPPPAAEETPEAAPEAPEAAETSTPAPAAPAAGSKGSAKGGEKSASAPPKPAPAVAKLPAIEHVFVIMLSDEPYASTFGPESPAPYLSRTLERRGELLARYYAVTHEQLANGIALISGQGPTPATVANCPVYAAVSPATPAAEEQVSGDGCVYPATVATLPGQLEVKRLTWRAYVQGIGEGAATPPACAHPALGQSDASSAQPGGLYATFRNPFMYFQGLTESPGCATDDVGLSALDADLARAKRTPSVSYIVPDRCHDGSPGPCPGGGPGGLPAADALLSQIVPKILASPAYKHGLLLITSDEAPSSGTFADSSSCCGQPHFPNLPAPTGLAASLPREGGGQVGALMLSPFVKGHTISQEPYDHFSLLRTIEDLFGLKHLGYAAAPKVEALKPALFTSKSGH
ncbi:MAG: alkaline phosphatase family protein [Solirubrobacteraceae bacterium]